MQRASKLLAPMLVLGFLLLPLFTLAPRPNQYEGGRSRDAGASQRRNASAVGRLFGEFRTAVGDLMFIKTERYLHSGMAYSAHVEQEVASVADTMQANEMIEREEQVKAGTVEPGHVHDEHCDHEPGIPGEAEATSAGHEDVHHHEHPVDDHHEHHHDHHHTHDTHGEHHHEHDHDHGEHGAHAHGDHHDHDHDHDHDFAGEEDPGYVSLVPGEEEDFRGFVGELYRKVQPYDEDGHHHTDGEELLPWFRVMTLTDPHYVRGYAVGAWWLKQRNEKEALAFVDQGIEHNPNAFQLYLVRGQIVLSQARQRAGASFYDPSPEVRTLIEKAHADFRKAGELAMAERPENFSYEEFTPEWPAYREEDAVAAARMDVLLERNFGEPAIADLLARYYLSFLKEDAVLEKSLGERLLPQLLTLPYTNHQNL